MDIFMALKSGDERKDQFNIQEECDWFLNKL